MAIVFDSVSYYTNVMTDEIIGTGSETSTFYIAHVIIWCWFCRGAYFINRVLTREIQRQKKLERAVLENIKSKMAKIKEKQSKLSKKNFVEPEEHFQSKPYLSLLKLKWHLLTIKVNIFHWECVYAILISWYQKWALAEWLMGRPSWALKNSWGPGRHVVEGICVFCVSTFHMGFVTICELHSWALHAVYRWWNTTCSSMVSTYVTEGHE